jgi:hypothetical protein
MSDSENPFGGPLLIERRLDDLSEEELCETLKITTFEKAGRHSEKVRKYAAESEKEIGNGKWCLRNNRCRKESCYYCRYFEQRRYVANYSVLLRETTWRKLLPSLRYAEAPMAITIVPWFGWLPVGGGVGDLRKFIQKIKDLLEHYAPGLVGFFCVDISWNVCRATGEEHWQLHVHGVVWNLDEESKEGLRDALKREAGEGGRPLLVKAMHYPDGWLAYMAKPNFFLRESCQDRKWKPDEGPLSLEQEVEMARWLSPYKASARHFTMGLSRSPTTACRKNKPMKAAV